MADDKDYQVHELGCCESTDIGAGTRIWAFAHVLPEAKIGENCNICDHVFIENDVVLGDRVTVKCGVQIWDGIVVEDDVFIGPNVTFTNDLYPRSKQHPEQFTKTLIANGASIGANATILPGITISQKAMIGAGAVVTRSVPPNAIVVGNPARIVGYVDSGQKDKVSPTKVTQAGDGATVQNTSVTGVTLHSIPTIEDLRGNLSAAEFDKHVPFDVNRYFLVFDVPSAETRGEHAHKECHQFLVCVSGSVAVVADDGNNREEFLLQNPGQAVYLPPMVWGIQYRYSSDAVLLVLASHNYDSDDYIRDYESFLELKSAK